MAHQHDSRGSLHDALGEPAPYRDTPQPGPPAPRGVAPPPPSAHEQQLHHPLPQYYAQPQAAFYGGDAEVPSGMPAHAPPEWFGSPLIVAPRQSHPPPHETHPAAHTHSAGGYLVGPGVHAPSQSPPRKGKRRARDDAGPSTESAASGAAGLHPALRWDLHEIREVYRGIQGEAARHEQGADDLAASLAQLHNAALLGAHRFHLPQEYTSRPASPAHKRIKTGDSEGDSAEAEDARARANDDDGEGGAGAGAGGEDEDDENAEGQRCKGCAATSTPEWRKGPLGPRTLCNACGLVYAKIIKRRTRHGADAGDDDGGLGDDDVSLAGPSSGELAHGQFGAAPLLSYPPHHPHLGDYPDQRT